MRVPRLLEQLPTKSWHESLDDPTIADAICDRLVHNAHVLTTTTTGSGACPKSASETSGCAMARSTPRESGAALALAIAAALGVLRSRRAARRPLSN